MLNVKELISKREPSMIENIDNIASPTNGQLKCRLPTPNTTKAPTRL